MDTLKNLLIDSMNGFSPKYIPLLIFQLLMAGLIAYVIQLLINKKFKEKIIQNAALVAPSIALIVGVSKFSLPFSVLAAAAILILAIKSKTESNIETIGLFLVAIIGVGCGVGSIVQTLIGALVLGLIILFLPLKK